MPERFLVSQKDDFGQVNDGLNIFTAIVMIVFLRKGTNYFHGHS